MKWSESLRMILAMALSIAFLYLFGIENLRRHAEGGLTIVKSSVPTRVIPSPVITVSVTSYGLDNKLCIDEEDLKSCIENERGAFLGKRKRNTYFFVDNYSVYHRIHPSNGSIKFHMQYSLQLKLLPQKEYSLMLFDPAYVIPSNNPEVVPRTSLIVKPNSIGNLYLKVIKHYTMNTEESPCESTAGYNVLSCVEKEMISRTGCRPPWINSSSTVRMCSYEDDSGLLRHYMGLMSDVTFMVPKRLYTEYGCMRPCTYFEYKLVEDPLMLRSETNETRISLMYASATIHVEKEEVAYPVRSLVADLGGSLGLFIGFNFLMIWDLIIFLVKKGKGMYCLHHNP